MIYLNKISFYLLLIFLLISQINGYSFPHSPDTIRNSISKPTQNLTDTNSIFHLPNCDGRFTLGSSGRRLMYGFPNPFSTSHFVLKVDSFYATNCPTLCYQDITDYFDEKTYSIKVHKRNIIQKMLNKQPRTTKKSHTRRIYLVNKGIEYLKDSLTLTFLPNMSLKSVITFKYDGISITQICSPVNSNLTEEETETYGQYYKIEYIVKNTTSKNRKVGLMEMFDTMIDKNDACKIQPFNTSETDSILYLLSKLENAKSRRGISEFFPNPPLYDKVPKRMLIYYNDKELINDFTGDMIIDKKDATSPDELFVGSWPFLNNVLWKFNFKRGSRYYDSAILMKWLEKSLEPNETRKYIVYYGLFNPGKVQLVASDKKTPEFASFNATPNEIEIGEKSVLKWHVNPNLDAKVRIGYITKGKKGRTKINYIGNEFPHDDKLIVCPDTNRLYVMEIIKDNKVISTLTEFLKVNFSTDTSRSQFTIGDRNGKSMLYGFPLPYSTSFFTVSCEDKYATNSNLALDDVKKIIGLSKKNRDSKGNIYYETEFLFYGLSIKQKLILCDSKLKPMSIIKAPYYYTKNNTLSAYNERFIVINPQNEKFYRIEYEIANQTPFEKKDVGLQLLFDLYSNSNDTMKIRADNNPVLQNTSFKGLSIPNVINDAGSIKNNICIYPKKDFSAKVDEIIYGQWQNLSKNLWDSKLPPIHYYDDGAILFRWLKRDLKPEESFKGVIYVGSENADSIKLGYDNSYKFQTYSVYFATGKFELTNSDLSKISDNIKKFQSKFILIEGFCDSQGDEEVNYHLAEKRVEEVRNAIVKYGYSPNKILVKVNGKYDADKKSKLNTDRRVDINFYK